MLVRREFKKLDMLIFYMLPCVLCFLCPPLPLNYFVTKRLQLAIYKSDVIYSCPSHPDEFQKLLKGTGSIQFFFNSFGPFVYLSILVLRIKSSTKSAVPNLFFACVPLSTKKLKFENPLGVFSLYLYVILF
jgi:hypothetical protein